MLFGYMRIAKADGAQGLDRQRLRHLARKLGRDAVEHAVQALVEDDVG